VTFDPFGDFESRGYLRNFAELAYRAGISIDWVQTDKTDYLVALTKELNDPEQGHLDNYLQPFIRDAVERQQSASVLKSL
jgi:cell filamentation protein